MYTIFQGNPGTGPEFWDPDPSRLSDFICWPLPGQGLHGYWGAVICGLSGWLDIEVSSLSH